MTDAPKTDNADILDRIAIEVPCEQDWNAMTGDDKRRFCTECRLHVHDLSAMRRPEAVALVEGAGRDGLCIQLRRRPDGRVVTQDCGPVRAALRRRAGRVRTVAAGFLGLLGAWFLPGCSQKTIPETENVLIGEALPAIRGRMVFIPPKPQTPPVPDDGDER